MKAHANKGVGTTGVDNGRFGGSEKDGKKAELKFKISDVNPF